MGGCSGLVSAAGESRTIKFNSGFQAEWNCGKDDVIFDFGAKRHAGDCKVHFFLSHCNLYTAKKIHETVLPLRCRAANFGRLRCPMQLRLSVLIHQAVLSLSYH